jgi:hypothetical protein
LETTGKKLYAMHAEKEAPWMGEASTIGIVVRTQGDGKVNDIIDELFSDELQQFGEKVKRRVAIARGLTVQKDMVTVEHGANRYVIYFDDGTDSPENMKRLSDFTESLGTVAQENETPKERTFAWILGNAKWKGKREVILKKLQGISYMAGLEADYTPASWQMLSGSLFAHYVDSRSRLEQKPKDKKLKLRVSNLKRDIIRSVKLMTKGRDITKILEQKDLKKIFDGLRLILKLPDMVPGTVESTQYRNADKRVLKSA